MSTDKIGLMDVIFKVQIDKSSLKELERTFGKLSTKLETRLVKITNKLSQEALNALKSKVPYDTGELRNTFLSINYATKANPVARVGIDEGTHLGRDHKPISSSELAFNLLNKGSGNRRDYSRAIPPYSSIGPGSPTAGWITSAKLAFGARRRSLIG